MKYLKDVWKFCGWLFWPMEKLGEPLKFGIIMDEKL